MTEEIRIILQQFKDLHKDFQDLEIRHSHDRALLIQRLGLVTWDLQRQLMAEERKTGGLVRPA